MSSRTLSPFARLRRYAGGVSARAGRTVPIAG